jgi:hypothetical protein
MVSSLRHAKATLKKKLVIVLFILQIMWGEAFFIFYFGVEYTELGKDVER